MGKPTPKKSTKRAHDEEAGVEEIMEQVDEHALSQSDVPKQTSLDFWQGIIEALRVRISALKGGDE